MSRGKGKDKNTQGAERKLSVNPRFTLRYGLKGYIGFGTKFDLLKKCFDDLPK